MASLVLGVVGTALGGPLGGFIGSTIGRFVDSALGLNGNVEGPRLKDLTVISSTYGNAIPLIYGPENRLSGNIIWSSGLIEKKKKKKSGKGGGPSVTTYSYSVSLAIALGEGPLATTSPGAVKRIWANGKKIFDVGDATSTPTPDANNVYVWLPSHKAHAVAEAITIYPGNGTQEPDPTIESYLGVGNVPGYRHTAYVLLKKIQLADFGNGIPNLEFEVEGGGSALVAAWVQDICARAAVSDVTTSSISDIGKGFVVGQAGITPVGALAPLSIAYRFDVSEQRGQIRCVKRGLGMIATIPETDLGAVEVSAGKDGAYAEPIRYERLPPMGLPRAAAVSFADPALDYQVNTQRASRQSGNADSNITHELPLTLSADEARGMADRILWEAWAARRSAKFPVSDRWMKLNPGDVVGLPAADRVVPFRLLTATRGANGVIDVEARYDDPEVYSSVMAGAAGYLPANPLELPGVTRLVCMDMPIVRAGDDDSGFYWAVSQEEDGWRGAEILRSSNGGVSYATMSPVAVGTAIGDVAAALPSGPMDYWDRGNSLTVTLAYADDELESKSEIEVLNGANAAWLGGADGQDGEILQFLTATLVSPGVYTLSNLLRGRMGTDHAVAAHGINEVFVLLDADSLGRTDYGAGDWYKSRLFKPVSVLTAEADTASQSFANAGEGKRPLSPVHVTGARDGSNNLTIAWTRRSRIMQPGLGYGEPALGEEVEAYEVDIIVGGVAVRTIAASIEAASYSAANQATDGITPGNPVTVDIYQLSVERGRGHARRAVI